MTDQPLSRRSFVNATLAGTTALVAGSSLAAPAKARPRVAAVFTEFRFRSHAYNILENFFEPFLFRGKLVDPGVDVVSFYADQFPAGDLARQVSKRLKVPLFKTIDKALCVGGRSLAVDAVLSIGEHGDYPDNARGQKMYPRKRFFDAIVNVMKRSGRFVPVFNDKHLSYRWDWAKEMYDTAKKHGIPLAAGSSVPLAQRVPMLDLPADAEISEAVSIHGGGMESYDFHALEVLQSIVEFRQGGETGISRVELLSGDLYRGAVNEGRWSDSLAAAAMDAEKRARFQRQRRPAAVSARSKNSTGKAVRGPAKPRGPHAIILTFKDGMQATILKSGGSSDRWNFACRLKGERKPRACTFFNGPWGNRCLFKALSHSIQHLFRTRTEPYPVERTLLATGVLDAAMRSHQGWGKPIDTPHLELAYKPLDFSQMREDGASWKKITVKTKQPVAFSPGDRKLLN